MGLASFKAEGAPFLDLVCMSPFRVFCDPSRTTRYVASSLFFFLDFLPLGFLMGIVCRLLDEAPSFDSSPGSVSSRKVLHLFLWGSLEPQPPSDFGLFPQAPADLRTRALPLFY